MYKVSLSKRKRTQRHNQKNKTKLLFLLITNQRELTNVLTVWSKDDHF